jgi:protein-tyrosine phosphatase
MIEGWVDAHCHILPQIDDGASDVSESLEMARIAAGDGIHTIIATPHVIDNRCPPEDIKKRVDELNQQLAAHEIPVTIYPAAEVSITLDLSLFHLYAINRTRHVLIELPCEHLPPFTEKLLSWLCAEGLKPIIAHPERNLGIIRNPSSFLNILNTQIFVQITAGSLTGDFGVDVQLCAEMLLDSGRVDIIASDAHSMKTRPPILSKAFEVASKRIGREAARRLVSANPRAVLRGER